MELAVPRQPGPLDLGGVVLLHLAVLAALLVVRSEPAPVGATAPIMAQIVQAPLTAPAGPRAQPPQHVPPLAMRTLPRRQPTPVQEAPQPTKTKVKPLTSSAPHAVREIATAAPKRITPPPPPKPLPRVAPAPPPAPVARAAEAEPTLPPVASAPGATASSAATAPTATPQRTAGSSGSPQDNRAYLSALLQQLNRFKVYPPALRQAKVEGRVVLTFTIDALGRVTFADVQRTSGHAALDAAAERMLARASPLPAIPSAMGKTSLTLSVPIEYSLLTDR
ncbi:MAG: TonB family protein [Acidobacteria bacterium]|nr:TonB family protein [Acidobacteriota bacterium]